MKKILLTLTLLGSVLFGGDFEDGLNAYNNKEYKKAVELFEKAVEKDNSDAQYALGLLYEDGKGVRQDYKKAAELYTKAADQGDASAQLNLGVLYFSGKGVKKDIIKSYQLHLKAANQGDVVAQNNLDKICKQSPWACK